MFCQHEWRELVRQGKHYVEVADGEQFFFGEPRASADEPVTLTLGAVPIATRVENDGAMATDWGTDGDVHPGLRYGSGRWRGARDDAGRVSQAPVRLDEAIAVLSDDVGHLEGWPRHRLCSRRDRRAVSGPDTVHRVQRVGHGVQVPTREMQIDDGVFELHVAEQQLDGAQVGAGFKQMRRVRVAQYVRLTRVSESARASRPTDRHPRRPSA